MGDKEVLGAKLLQQLDLNHVQECLKHWRGMH